MTTWISGTHGVGRTRTAAPVQAQRADARALRTEKAGEAAKVGETLPSRVVATAGRP